MNNSPKLKTIRKQLSSKTVLIQDNPYLKEEIRSYFLQTYQLYEKLFSIINTDRAYYIRPEPLRHPLIFYYGHTAAVYINKSIDHGIIKKRINEKYQKTFAVGVDQMDWDDLQQSHYDWPSVADAKDFRQKVKAVILETIDNSTTRKIQSWLTDMWVILMGIEHERIHLQTSAVIMRRLPLEMVNPIEDFVECQARQITIQNIPKNRMVKVDNWKSTWERKKEGAKTYGWDNQFGEKQFDVKEFNSSEMLVSNGEFLQFIKENGYNRPDLWTEEGQRWLASVKQTMPLFWRKDNDKYRLRTLFRQIQMPWNWPAQVSNLQARAFCKWKSLKTGKYIRLPTEDEYYAIRSTMKQDQPDWKYQSVGNINLEYWMSPNPVDMFKYGNFYDIVGNVWQHTITPIYGFDKFDIHPAYEDFSTPTFDQRHDMIKGGSFISTGNEALYHARFGFRRHFYQFTGFRYIQTDFEIDIDIHQNQLISDKNVEMNLKHHYLNDKSYIFEVVEKLKQKKNLKDTSQKVLTVGCSVGRIPLQLGKIFEESIGIDYTTRYFQMSTRLKEKGFLKFKDIDINLQRMNIKIDNVNLLQMNPENPDEKKINSFDWIIVDGFSIKKGTLDIVLGKVTKLAARNATIVVLNVQGINELKKQEIKNILMKACDGEVEIREQEILKASEGDQSYLPGLNGRTNFRLNYFKIMSLEQMI